MGSDSTRDAWWRQEISAFAELPNVACKVSGLGRFDRYWTVESLRPWVLYAIEAFGVDRVVFGSNWPVDLLFTPYVEQVDAYRQIIADAGLNTADQARLLHSNAERLYQI